MTARVAGRHRAADGADRPRRSPADSDGQDRRRPHARPDARHARRRDERRPGGGCRRGPRPRARTRPPSRALHRRWRQPLARRAVAADLACDGPPASRRAAPVCDRRGGRASRRGACADHRTGARDPARGRAHGPPRDVLDQRQGRARARVPALERQRRRGAIGPLVSRSRHMPPDRRVLAVCAMGMEAWGVRRRAHGVRVVKVGIGGAPPGRAAQHSIVISTGLCGGLTPDQVPGMVVIATTVADERGATFACDPQVVAALQRATQSLGFPVVTGPVISTQAMVTGADRATWAARGHVAVDMESALAAPTARRFGVLRVILDTPHRELSPAWANPGARDPQSRELGRCDLARRERPSLLAPGRCRPRGSPLQRYRPRGIAAPRREASERRRARRTRGPSRGARLAGRGAPPRPLCSPPR